MNIKLTLDAPRGGLRRLVLFVFLPIALILSVDLAAHAFDTSWIASGQVLSATKLKAALDEAQTRLMALEAAQTKQVMVTASIAEDPGPGGMMNVIVRQQGTGGWTISGVNRNGAGDYTLTFGGVTLAQKPVCVGSIDSNWNGYFGIGGYGSYETTSFVNVHTASYGTSASPADMPFRILCHGTKS
jgi:hypothetical protein